MTMYDKVAYSLTYLERPQLGVTSDFRDLWLCLTAPKLLLFGRMYFVFIQLNQKLLGHAIQLSHRWQGVINACQ